MSYNDPHYDARETRGVVGGRRVTRHKRKTSPIVLEPLDRRRGRRRRRSNQSSEDEDDEQDDEDRIASFVYPPMAMVCLPPFRYVRDHRDIYDYNHESDIRRRRDHRSQRTSKRNGNLHSRTQRQRTHSNSSSLDEGDARIRDRGIGSQRVRSLRAMARVQRNAARVIQQEFRFYRNRKQNRIRQLARLDAQAERLLDSFLCEGMLPSLISNTLLDVLREDAAQRALGQLSGEPALLSYSEHVYQDILGDLVRSVFQVALDSLVREYMVSRVDLSRLSQPSSHVVADELTNEWIVELVADILPEALSELALSYMDARRQDERFQSLVAEEIRDVAVETATELTLADMVDTLTLTS